MISAMSLIIFSLLLVNIQSIPIKNALLMKSSNPLSVSEQNGMKIKRRVFDDINNRYKLYSKIKETPAPMHDNVDESVIFTDIKMNSNELKNSVRKRRNINLENQRHKRDLSEYDFYNGNPLHWYPSFYKRNIPSSFTDTQEWNNIYPYTIQNEDLQAYQAPFFIDDYDENEDDDDGNEYDRYPILSDSLNIPYDNLQLQQKYNIIDSSPSDDDEFFLSRYGPIENYFK